MTNKSFPFALTLLALFCVPSFAQTGATKTFTKAFNTEGKGVVRFDLPGDVDLKVWDNPSIRVEIGISLPSSNGSMLNELANIGRYNLSAKPDGDVLIVSAPNLQKTLKVKGEELKETINFAVFVPKDLQVEVLPTVPELADAKK
jgi:hypothetical protein